MSMMKQYKKDFMVGHGKGGHKDNIERQRPSIRKKLAPEEIKNLYANNQIVQNIIDIPAEDMTRAWFTLQMEDEKLKRQIMDKLRDLNAREKFQDMRHFERLSGDGFVSLGVTQSTPFDLSKPLDPYKVKSIDYLHAFSGFKVGSWLINEDMFSPTYGQVEQFRINRRSRLGTEIAGSANDPVHHTRVIHDQTRRMEDEHQGQPMLEPLYDIIKVLDTSLWSVGQILYDFTFKIYKSEDIDDMTATEKSELGMILDYMFRTEALAIIGANESLSKEGTNTTGLDALLDYVWDFLSGAVRMPKTVIKGQESGTITGAQYDVMNYYSRIAAQQENELRPKLEHLIRLIMLAEDEVGGRIDPDKVNWHVKFNPLWQVDAETDAKIRKTNAETDQIYIANGVITADEARESRFGQYGVASESQLTSDSLKIYDLSEEEIKALADKFYKSRESRD